MADPDFNNFEALGFGFNQKLRGDKGTAFSLEGRNFSNNFFFDKFKTAIDVFYLKTKKEKDCQLPDGGTPLSVERNFTAQVIANNQVSFSFFLGVN